MFLPLFPKHKSFSQPAVISHFLKPNKALHFPTLNSTLTRRLKVCGPQAPGELRWSPLSLLIPALWFTVRWSHCPSCRFSHHPRRIHSSGHLHSLCLGTGSSSPGYVGGFLTLCFDRCWNVLSLVSLPSPLELAQPTSPRSLHPLHTAFFITCHHLPPCK